MTEQTRYPQDVAERLEARDNDNGNLINARSLINKNCFDCKTVSPPRSVRRSVLSLVSASCNSQPQVLIISSSAGVERGATVVVAGSLPDVKHDGGGGILLSSGGQ